MVTENEPVKLSAFIVPSAFVPIPKAWAWKNKSGERSVNLRTVFGELSAVADFRLIAEVPVSFIWFLTVTVMFSENFTPSEFVYTTLNKKLLFPAALALSSKSSSVTVDGRRISPVELLIENLFTSIVEPV